ncbi:TerB family tellurite resistance protein [Rhodobacteraceae bacterium M385]|nr:TerB family tellurite resistance protein [Rhodobacteraceae bacterium M385]
MISDLLSRLLAPAPEPLPQADARLALAALLVRVARSDGDYAAVEIARIDALLADRYGLLPGQAKTLRAQAEALEAQAPDTVRFTRAIKDSVDHDDRLDVVEALWDIALADGERDEDENALMRLVAPMLGINDRDSNLARRRVEANL